MLDELTISEAYDHALQIGVADREVSASPSTQAGFRRAAPLHERDFIPCRIVCNLIHEGANQKQAATADAHVVFGVDRAIDPTDVETRSLVANDKRRRVSIDRRVDMDSPLLVRAR